MRNPLPPGCRIDEYEIVRVLGMGGFGITYLAFDHMLDGPVALKEYFPTDIAVRTDGLRVAASAAGQEVFDWGLDRFLKEARAIHRLRHPNLVRVHRYVERHGTAYIVMEYVEGESLASILKSRGRLPVDEWRPWLDRLLDGLAHVHDHDYLHRDIKPANIVIRAADGEPVLIDFGAARVASQQRTHTQVLTPGYAPIEQYTSQGTQGPPIDIYALAAVSCRVLTGEPPPSAPDRVLDDRYEPLEERMVGAGAAWLTAIKTGVDLQLHDPLDPSAPPAWLESIDHGLALRPEARPQTVSAWRAALHSADGMSMDIREVDSLRAEASLGDAQALTTLRRAAGRGQAVAQFNLGEIYRYRWSPQATLFDAFIVKDDAEAVRWYRQAAAQGHPGAHYRLGEMYRRQLAGDRASIEPFVKLGEQASRGEINESLYQKQVEAWFQRARQAVRWYRHAADSGHKGAQYRLGELWESWYGVKELTWQGLAWSYRGEDTNATCYEQDLGECSWQAAEWYRKAADQEHPGAQYRLGVMYEEGQDQCGWGLRQDSTQAISCYRSAASRGHTDAQRRLGEMYEGGDGVPQNRLLAHLWFCIADEALPQLERGMARSDAAAKQSGMGAPGFDKEACGCAELYFQEAWRHAQDTGASFREFVKAMREFLVETLEWDRQQVKRMLRHFAGIIRSNSQTWRGAKPDPNRLGAVIPLDFDEEAYARPEPHFRAAWEHAVKAGESLESFVRAMRELLVQKAGWDNESTKRMLRHFVVTEIERRKDGGATVESGQLTDARGTQRRAAETAADEVERRAGVVPEE